MCIFSAYRSLRIRSTTAACRPNVHMGQHQTQQLTTDEACMYAYRYAYTQSNTRTTFSYCSTALHSACTL